MNSCNKGKVGEREWRDFCRDEGYDARRGQQHAGGADSPDVICPALHWIHFEVKRVQRLCIEDAMSQAHRDAGGKKVPVVAHRRNHCPWLVTMDAETFFQFVRGDLPPEPPKEDDGHTCYKKCLRCSEPIDECQDFCDRCKAQGVWRDG
jgi:hypothetical protein